MMMSEINDDSIEKASRRVQKAALGFKRLGFVSFWAQLALSLVSAGIVVFTILYRSATKINAEIGLYFTLFGVIFSLISTFWTLGYGRIGRKLEKSVQEPQNAPSRAQVVRSLTTGIQINMTGLTSTMLGLQASCGLLFAKSLSFAAQNPYTVASNSSPVMALDIFVVQQLAENNDACVEIAFRTASFVADSDALSDGTDDGDAVLIEKSV
eukprot:gene9067-10744_t